MNRQNVVEFNVSIDNITTCHQITEYEMGVGVGGPFNNMLANNRIHDDMESRYDSD